jgi:hypothetical protein
MQTHLHVHTHTFTYMHIHHPPCANTRTHKIRADYCLENKEAHVFYLCKHLQQFTVVVVQI